MEIQRHSTLTFFPLEEHPLHGVDHLPEQDKYTFTHCSTGGNSRSNPHALALPNHSWREVLDLHVDFFSHEF